MKKGYKKMKLITANWKEHPTSVAEAIALATATDDEGVVICPPVAFLREVGSVLKKAQLGAQDWIPEIKNLGARYVIIGHSDRRKLGETNEIVAEKLAAVVGADLIPILCIGETLEQKNAGEKEKILTEQLTIGLSNIENWKFLPAGRHGKIENFYIAYEPVWAISTNPNAQPDTPEETQKTLEFIKGILTNMQLPISKYQFLYGGSVNSSNAAQFLSLPDIAGALVGGASLKVKEMKEIVAVAGKY